MKIVDIERDHSNAPEVFLRAQLEGKLVRMGPYVGTPTGVFFSFHGRWTRRTHFLIRCLLEDIVDEVTVEYHHRPTRLERAEALGFFNE